MSYHLISVYQSTVLDTRCTMAYMKLKRRILYLSDHDWEEVRGLSKETGLTMSAIIRRAIDVSAVPSPRLRREVLDEVRQAVAAAPSAQRTLIERREVMALLDELETPA